MQRKAIRATVGATDVDIPIHTFLPDQVLVYSGGAITTEVRVRVVGSPTAGNLASWFNAETITDSGILAADIVHNPGTSVTRQIAVFSDATGKAIAAAPVQVDTLGALTLVTNINGRPVDSFVTGPASATSSNVAKFNGTTGKAIIDSGVPIDSVVQSSSTPTANQVATFTGSGIVIQSTSVTIVGGALTNVTTINGTTVGDWVTGPASATNTGIATFNGTTGKIIQSTAVAISGTTISAATVISGKTISTLVNGNTGSVNLNLPQYSGTSGQVLQDSGILATNVVTTTSSPAGGQIPTFVGVGKTIQSTSVFISGTTIFSASTLTIANSARSVEVSRIARGPSFAISLNELVCYTATTAGNELGGTGILYTNVVVNSGVSTNNDLVVFNGSSGKSITDSGVNLTDVPLCSVAGSANAVATFTGSGKTIQGTTVVIVAGAVTGVTSLNYTAIDNYMITDGSTFGGNDVPSYGSGFAPKFTTYGKLGSQSVSSSYVEPTNFRFIGPGRSGNFSMTWDFVITLGDTSGNVGMKVFWSSGTGVAFCTFNAAGTLTFTTSGTAATFTVTGTTPQVMGCRCVLTVTGASSAVNVYIQLQKSSGTGFTVSDGGLGVFRQLD